MLNTLIGFCCIHLLSQSCIISLLSGQVIVYTNAIFVEIAATFDRIHKCACLCVFYCMTSSDMKIKNFDEFKLIVNVGVTNVVGIEREL
jgi:hypothetical protein